MKRNRITRQLLALALTLGMALALAPSLALPAGAAGAGGSQPQITIRSDNYNYVSTPEDTNVKEIEKEKLKTRFWAYQIFVGTIDEDKFAEEVRDNTDINDLKVTGWGASIQADKKSDLLDDLSKDQTRARDLGVTFELMLQARETYLNAAGLETYKEIYESAEIWIDHDAEKTEQNLTSNGKEQLKAAFNDALNREKGYLTIGNVFAAAYDRNKVDNDVKGAFTASQVIADFTGASGNTALTQAFYAIVFDRYSSNDVIPPGSDPGDYKYLKKTGGEAIGNTDNKYEGAYAVSSWKDSTTTGTKGCWYIGTWNGTNLNSCTLPAGYYMIRDVYEEKGNEGKASASYMAGVYGYGTIDPKAEAPEVKKTISDTTLNGAGRELSATITFTLKGTLPKNYFTAYKGYPYIFEDTMDAGLDYLGGGEAVGTMGYCRPFRVYVKVPNSNGWFSSGGAKYDYYLVDLYTGPEDGNQGKGYRLEVTPGNGESATTVIVSFPNLQNVVGRRATQYYWNNGQWQNNSVPDPIKIPITNDSEVYVEYTARLNEGANITDPGKGNQNKVVLHYANEPLWDPEASGGDWDKNWKEAPMGRSTRLVFLYDFGVQLTVYGKKDADEPGADEMEGRKPLKDAGFALKKGSGNNIQYAILHKAATPKDNSNASESLAEYTYYLAGWVSEADLYSYLAGAPGEASKSWSDALEEGAEIGGFPVPAAASLFENDPEGGEPDAEGDYYAAVVTDENGVVRIVGLDNSAYVLEEVITPQGSATVNDISVRFDTTGYDATGKLTDLAATADGSAIEKPGPQNILSRGEFTDAYKPYSELVARLIINTESTIEVDTGGMGTALFYIGGGALLAGAALILIISNAKSKKPEKRGR